MSFARDLDRFRLKVDAAHSDLARGVALELFRSVIMDSPVDTGRFRGNWQATISAPAASDIDRHDKNGSAAINAMSAIVSAWSGSGVAFLANNLPYAAVLEYGKYPTPVKFGTRLPSGKYEVRSVSGYSKQAPQGMVRKNIARIQSIVDRQARKHKV